MAELLLFQKENIVGIFRGFQQGGLEFHADLVLPYRNDFQNIPMHGQFVLVQLENPNEAVLGRITSFSSEGKLSFGSGEEFNIRAVREDRAVPEDLREQYLKYRINIRVLGVERRDGDRLTFVPSHRRLPHVGSPVAFPAGELLRELAGHNTNGADIGHLAFGEYIYASPETVNTQPWTQLLSPEVKIRFPVESLVSRRSFIFARAGFGKSNLNKLLFSRLYEETPTVTKRDGRKVPVGTIIFDPDGEYFWPDDNGRPGLCDVPALEDKLVVFTPRQSPSPFYQSFVAGGIRLDIRRLRPADVIAIALSADRQDQQNVRKLRALSASKWEQLVNAIDENKNATPLADIAQILDLDPQKQEAEALAARSNMNAIVGMLHDRSSRLMDMLMQSLAEGKICVVDVSQMRGAQALVLSGLILRRIFDRNQQEFTSANPKTIPTIAVIEEAQSVLVEGSTSSEPYISWVKEGRKYDLGALLITQQPGSLPIEILSQGDNWFIFHLLSSSDLQTLKRANAHFSDDILSSLLNEPIPGQGVYWSSVGGKPYPLSLRVASFEAEVQVRDSLYNLPAGETYAATLTRDFNTQSSAKKKQSSTPAESSSEVGESYSKEAPDAKEGIETAAIEGVVRDGVLLSKLASPEGIAWGAIKYQLLKYMPENLDGRDDLAYALIDRALDAVTGSDASAGVKKWETARNSEKKLMVKKVR